MIADDRTNFLGRRIVEHQLETRGFTVIGNSGRIRVKLLAPVSQAFSQCRMTPNIAQPNVVKNKSRKCLGGKQPVRLQLLEKTYRRPMRLRDAVQLGKVGMAAAKVFGDGLECTIDDPTTSEVRSAAMRERERGGKGRGRIEREKERERVRVRE